jgi:hypothetical protein
MTHKIVFHSRSNSVCRLIEIIKTHTHHTIPLNSKTAIHTTTKQQDDKNTFIFIVSNLIEVYRKGIWCQD